MTTFDIREINRLIRAGTPVYGIYESAGHWITGRLQRVRRHSPLAWQAQPWEGTAWADLKSSRQVWVQWHEEAP